MTRSLARSIASVVCIVLQKSKRRTQTNFVFVFRIFRLLFFVCVFCWWFRFVSFTRLRQRRPRPRRPTTIVIVIDSRRQRSVTVAVLLGVVSAGRHRARRRQVVLNQCDSMRSQTLIPKLSSSASTSTTTITQPHEIYVNEGSKLTLHGLQQ